MDFSLFDFGVDDDYNNDDYNDYGTNNYEGEGLGSVDYNNSASTKTLAPSTATQQAPLGTKSTMRCDTCGSTKFRNVDGTYICSVCGTISHKYVETMQDIEWAEVSAMNLLYNRIDGGEHFLKDKTFRESKTTLFLNAIRTCLEAHLDVMVDPNGLIAAPQQLRDVVLLLYDTWAESQ